MKSWQLLLIIFGIVIFISIVSVLTYVGLIYPWVLIALIIMIIVGGGVIVGVYYINKQRTSKLLPGNKSDKLSIDGAQSLADNFMINNLKFNCEHPYEIIPHTVGQSGDPTYIYLIRAKREGRKEEICLFIDRVDTSNIGVLKRRLEELPNEWEKRIDKYCESFAKKPQMVSTTERSYTDPITGRPITEVVSKTMSDQQIRIEKEEEKEAF